MGNKFGKLIIKHSLTGFDFLKNKTIVIDGSIYLYKFCAAYVQTNGELFKNKQNRVTSHLYGLLKLLSTLLSYKTKIIFVVDGSPHFLKASTIEKRRLLKTTAHQYREYLTSINSSNLNLIKSLKQKSFKITTEMYDSLKDLLNLLGIPFIQAKAEGEAQCVWFVKNGIADYAFSDDWDLLLYNLNEFYRNISIKNKSCDYINIEQNLSNLQIDKKQLVSAIIMSGTDYNKSLSRVGPITALKLIKTYNSIREIKDPLNKYNVPILYQKHDEIIKYLENYDAFEIYKLEFKAPDLNNLENYLHDFCNFSHQYILENIKLLL